MKTSDNGGLLKQVRMMVAKCALKVWRFYSVTAHVTFLVSKVG